MSNIDIKISGDSGSLPKPRTPGGGLSGLTLKPYLQSNESPDPIKLEAVATLGTVVRFLLGSRSAILTLAANPGTFWLGLAFVLSAGFAREYSRTDLSQDTWVLFLPLAGAILISLGLFPAAEIVAWFRGFRGGKILSRYFCIVGLIWMSAPLGWIFAIPVEYFLSPDEAVIANLWFLGLLSVWRILLVTRILSILYNPTTNEVAFTGMFMVVMLVTDTLAICMIGPVSLPMLVGTLGGTRPTAAEHVVLGIKFIMTMCQVFSWPVWLVGTLAITFWTGPRWSWTLPVDAARPPSSNALKLLAAAALVVWIFVLPWTQPEVQRRHPTEHVLPSQTP